MCHLGKRVSQKALQMWMHLKTHEAAGSPPSSVGFILFRKALDYSVFRLIRMLNESQQNGEDKKRLWWDIHTNIFYFFPVFIVFNVQALSLRRIIVNGGGKETHPSWRASLSTKRDSGKRRQTFLLLYTTWDEGVTGLPSELNFINIRLRPSLPWRNLLLSFMPEFQTCHAETWQNCRFLSK